MLKTNLTDKRIPFMIISILIILLAGAWSTVSTYDTAKELSGKPNGPGNEETEQVEDAVSYPQPDQFINMLILGLDEHGLSDQIVIASYNIKTHQVILTSIPRNTYVSEQTWSEKGLAQSHLCFAHYAGLGEEKDYHRGAFLSARWIEYLLGIPIHEYVSIEYESFVYLIDRIGGVEVYVDPAFADIIPTFRKVIKEPLPTGLQHLDGEQAFAYAHYRGDLPNHPIRVPEPGSDSADGDRLRRNQRLLKAVYEQARSLKMLELLPILKELPQHIHTSLTVWDITAFAPAVYKVNMNEIITIVLPGEFKEVYEEGAGKYTHYNYLDFDKSHAILKGFGLK